MANAKPSFGYHPLALMLTDEGKHNLVITTNFDIMYSDPIREQSIPYGKHHSVKACRADQISLLLLHKRLYFLGRGPIFFHIAPINLVEDALFLYTDSKPPVINLELLAL